MTSNGISFLGQSLSQVNRLKDLRVTMADLQRQMTTQKRYENFSGLGTDSFAVQSLRADATQTQTYLDNVKSVTLRINLMSKSIMRAADIGRQLVDSIQNREGGLDIDVIKQLAGEGLEFMRDLLNIKVDDRYLFSGSATTTEPFSDLNTLNTNFQNETADWLSGVNTTAQFIANAEGFNATQLGLNPTLSTAGPVNMRVSEFLDIDYTVLADSDGFRDVIRALSFAANLEAPDLMVDIPDEQEMKAVLERIVVIARQGVAALDSANVTLGSRFNLIKSLEEGHEQDLNLFRSLTEDREGVDTTEVITSIQLLQTQLTSSYQVTGLVSQMSLINYLNF
jgi:flagellar hook-associated protein 3 FlgL